jgi:hypothetical protein
MTAWKTARLGFNDDHPEAQLWPDVAKPRERIGKSMLLYCFPPAVR